MLRWPSSTRTFCEAKYAQFKFHLFKYKDWNIKSYILSRYTSVATTFTKVVLFQVGLSGIRKLSTNFYFLGDKYLAGKFYASLLLILVENVSTQIHVFKDPRFQYKRNFVKLTTFSIGRIEENQAKLVTTNILINNYQHKCKIRLGPFPDFAYVSNYLQRFLHGNKTVQYL